MQKFTQEHFYSLEGFVDWVPTPLQRKYFWNAYTLFFTIYHVPSLVSFPKFCKFITCTDSWTTCKVGHRTDHSPTNRPGRKFSWPRYHRNKLQRQGRLTCHSDFNFFSFNLRQYRTIDNLKNCSEIVMKLICLNFSANLPQFPAISTKTKYAYYAKNCLPMYLLMRLVFA